MVLVGVRAVGLQVRDELLKLREANHGRKWLQKVNHLLGQFLKAGVMSAVQDVWALSGSWLHEREATKESDRRN